MDQHPAPLLVRGQVGGAALVALFVAPNLPAQSLHPAAPSPAQLTRYDVNRNDRIDPEEQEALRADEAKARAAATATGAAAAEGEPVQLSPFEVVADSRGYFASNTLSGTRLNSKIEDLGASITVITKQQLLDTAALDINDVFLFEANTEGIDQFTDQTVDFQGRVIDNVQASPQTSNRVRGLAAANVTRDGFSSASRIPFDTYNLDSVEISRGPNSSLSGLGDAGGTVNLNQTRAHLTRASSQWVLRGDNWSGGKPTYDPVTGTTRLNGAVIGVGLGDCARPRGLGRDAFFDNIPSLYHDRGTIALFMPNRLQAAGIPTTANYTNNIRLMTTWSDVAKYRNASPPDPSFRSTISWAFPIARSTTTKTSTPSRRTGIAIRPAPTSCSSSSGCSPRRGSRPSPRRPGGSRIPTATITTR